MSNQDTSDRPAIDRSYWPVALILALALVLLWLLGYGPYGLKCQPSLAASAPAIAVAPTPALPSATIAAKPSIAEPAAAPVAPPTTLPPTARVYFGVDSDEPRADSRSVLQEIVDYLRVHPAARVVVSGFHDPSGNAAYNEDLARRRAIAVQRALETAGIAGARIERVKPSVTSPGGPRSEARRVEVSVAPGR